jgi:hypothetical protein
MILSLFTLAAVSKLSDWLFHSGRLHPKWDVFHCVVAIPEDRLKVRLSSSKSAIYWIRKGPPTFPI